MKKFFKGFTYALKGLKYAFTTQINFRFHSAAAVLVLCLALYFRISIVEWLWIIAAIGIVLIAELFNTALEVLVNLVSPDHHPKAGIIKDVSAAAVFITCVIAALIGLLIFTPKLL
jgi:diacylglycerol kinase